MHEFPHAQPWLSLSDQVAELLQDHADAVAAEVIRVLPLDVPEYARPMEGRFGAGLARGVQIAFARFAALPGTNWPALGQNDREVYVKLGRGEVGQGRTLDALLAAYRSGARTAFREFSAIALYAGLDSADVVILGESVLAYIEELSAASAHGYAGELSERAGERGRLRVALADLLLRGEADAESLASASRAADWSIPERLLAVSVPEATSEGIRAALPQSLTVARHEETVVLLPEPTSVGARVRLNAALAGRGVGVGPVRAARQVAESLRLARAVRAVAGGSEGAAVWADDHLADLIVHAEPDLVRQLTSLRLEPLADLRAGQRQRLTQTLASWLRHRGQRALMAAELHVHEQTIGYRVAQLRDLFGDELDDPDARFELELVLRAAPRP
ncbi:MAG TPA: helix-turn-helix domain-containing protein [Propionibacteriaceae bacterium]|nr:helix-turn-helix domain-containing protein [Propionibacteriaceae bacterium]